MLNPCAKNSASPAFRLGAIASAYRARWVVSGVSTMITSAQAQASAGASTVRPAASALARDLDCAGRPTRTSQPESRRLSACAWPWEP